MMRKKDEEVERLRKILARQLEEGLEAKKALEWGQTEESFQRMQEKTMTADLDDLGVLPSELEDEMTWSDEWSKDPMLAKWSSNFENCEIGEEVKLEMEVK
jgi:hypothetical protein